MNQRRLATVVRVRELQERLARGEIARRRNILTERRRAEALAWSLVRPQTSQPLAGTMFVSRQEMLAVGVHDAEHEAARVELAVVDVDDALANWRYEAQRLDGVERLAERIASEAEAEQLRHERVELDDIVISRWRAEPEVATS